MTLQELGRGIRRGRNLISELNTNHCETIIHGDLVFENPKYTRLITKPE